MSSKVTDFIQRAAADIRANEPDPRKGRLQSWLSSLDSLYGQIGEWLGESVAAGSVTEPKRIKKTIHEDAVGTYEVDDLIFKIADQTVTIEPRATYVLFADGRADMKAASGREVILIRKNGEWRFTDMASRAAAKQPQLLDEDGFIKALSVLLRK